MTKLLRYYHTIKYLKFQQIYYRILFKLKKSKPLLGPTPATRKNAKIWCAIIQRKKNLIAPNRLMVLNQEQNIASNTIWNAVSCDKLWLYNLHYFDDLNAENAKQRTKWHVVLINRWIKENPVGFGNGWEPYTLSLRIVNWIKWLRSGNQPTPEILNSLAIQTRFLAKRVEWHLLGNHILANAKALIFAGLFFEGKEADQWVQQGSAILDQQLPEQILADGAHFELSPMYQGILLEDMLDLIQLYQLYHQDVPSSWVFIAKKMLNWLKRMCHPDGRIAFFNDAAFGISPELKDLEIYTRNLAVVGSDEIPLFEIAKASRLLYFANSGYCQMKLASAFLLADVGAIGPDYLPGHAHADSLSFEFSLDKQRIIINSGISTYERQPLRNQQRGTAAHNTLVIDHKDSSEIWGNFRVARRARTFDVHWQETEDFLLLQACHNGYCHFSGKPVHKRGWQLCANQLMIEDQILGEAKHDIKLFFHLYPGILVEQIDKKHLIIRDQVNKILGEFTSNYAIQIEDGSFYPEFNKTIQNQKIVIHLEQDLPVSIITRISWN